jgi:hypothetical protein
MLWVGRRTEFFIQAARGKASLDAARMLRLAFQN